MTTPSATLDIRRPSAHVAEVWLNRPEVRNAFNDAVIAELTRAFAALSRDEHLRSADFFNVTEFPEAAYKSSRLIFSGDNLEAVEGSLTLLGVTKPVKLSVTAFKCGPHPFTRKDMCGADASAVSKRSDFGTNSFVGPVSDDVKLSINVEAYKE